MRSDVSHGRDLNPTAASLLGLLADGPRTGWDLAAEAERRVGDFWTVTRSQVYRELADMSAAGLVDAGPPEGRDRRPYTVTARGRELFGQWLDQTPGPDQIRIPLLLTLAFARHLPEARVRELLERARAEHAERLESYEALDRELSASGDEPFRRTTLRYGLHHERAVLGWLDELLTETP